jgi:hypothetical protein
VTDLRLAAQRRTPHVIVHHDLGFSGNDYWFVSISTSLPHFFACSLSITTVVVTVDIRHPPHIATRVLRTLVLNKRLYQGSRSISSLCTLSGKRNNFVFALSLEHYRSGYLHHLLLHFHYSLLYSRHLLLSTTTKDRGGSDLTRCTSRLKSSRHCGP